MILRLAHCSLAMLPAALAVPRRMPSSAARRRAKTPSARAVVTIVGSRGNVLHRRADRTGYRADRGALHRSRQPPTKSSFPARRRRDCSTSSASRRIRNSIVQGMSAHRASADVALLQLSEPLPKSKSPSPFGAPARIDRRRRLIHRCRHWRHQARRWQERRHHPRSRSRCHRQARHVADPPGRSRDQQRARRPRRLHRRFRRAGVRGSKRPRRHRRRGVLVDRRQQQPPAAAASPASRR